MTIAGIKNSINHFIWQQDLKSLPVWKVRTIRILRIAHATGRDIAGGLISLRAMGLVYTTLLSLVPLLAVSFSVLKGFGVHNRLEPLLMHLFTPLGTQSSEIVNRIIGFVDNIKVGALGTFGLLILLFTVLSLVKKIETAFNYSWRISATRNLGQRFSNYLSVIMVGPVLIFTGVGIKASIHNSTIVNDILMIEPFGSLILLAGKILPFLITIAVFSFIYMLVPNTRVKIKSAFAGAIAATILWEITSRVFAAFISNSTNYTAIYSSFAILIVFMLWLYATWFIVLIGASFSFYHQHPAYTSARQQYLPLSCRLREKLALIIMQQCGEHFHHQKSPLSSLQLSKKIDISEHAILLVCKALEQTGLLIRVEGKKNSFIPAQSLETIGIATVIRAVRKAEESTQLHPDSIMADQKVEAIISQLDQAMEQGLDEMTVKDIV